MRQLKITRSITNRSLAIEKYFTEISIYPILSPEEEVEVAFAARKGDQKAKQKLINSNLRFVVSVAKQYQNQRMSLMDLIEAGNMGLMKAAELFDETRGFKFISYAVWWIRQAILMELTDHSRTVRLPLNMVSVTNKVKKVTKEWLQEFEREPTPMELSEQLNIPEGQIDDVLRLLTPYAFLDENKENEDGKEKFVPILSTSHSVTEEPMFLEDAKIIVEGFLDKLTPIERKVLELYYGVSGVSPIGLVAIGEKLKLTSERVRQIKLKALRKLQKKAKMLSQEGKDIVPECIKQ